MTIKRHLKSARFYIQTRQIDMAEDALRLALADANRMRHNAAKSRIMSAMNYLRAV